MHEPCCFYVFALVLSFVSVSDPTHHILLWLKMVAFFYEYVRDPRYVRVGASAQREHAKNTTSTVKPCRASSLLPGAACLVD